MSGLLNWPRNTATSERRLGSGSAFGPKRSSRRRASSSVSPSSASDSTAATASSACSACQRRYSPSRSRMYVPAVIALTVSPHASRVARLTPMGLERWRDGVAHGCGTLRCRGAERTDPVTPRDLEVYLHEHIPLSQAMQVSVVEASPDRVVLRAPLAPNINHRDTVFGGSSASLAMLASWLLLLVRLESEGLECRLVVQRGTMTLRAADRGRLHRDRSDLESQVLGDIHTHARAQRSSENQGGGSARVRRKGGLSVRGRVRRTGLERERTVMIIGLASPSVASSLDEGLDKIERLRRRRCGARRRDRVLSRGLPARPARTGLRAVPVRRGDAGTRAPRRVAALARARGRHDPRDRADHRRRPPDRGVRHRRARRGPGLPDQEPDRSERGSLLRARATRASSSR